MAKVTVGFPALGTAPLGTGGDDQRASFQKLLDNWTGLDAGFGFDDAGGIYLGGSVAANLLDDYEEGSWTPEFGGGTTDPTITYTLQEGGYTKIGNLVYVSGRIVVLTVSGGTGSLLIKGLPFTVLSANRDHALGISFKNTFLTDGPDFIECLSNSTTAQLYKNNNTGLTSLTPANLQIATILIFSGCYHTAA